MKLLKTIAICLLAAVSLSAWSQQHERRVYYLDCSYSMKTNGLWNTVTTDLKKAINKITDQNTEIVIIPFAIDSSTVFKSLKPIQSRANKEGKSDLCDFIDKLKPDSKSMTYHHMTLEDFYNNKRMGNESTITYMFILTDGKDEDNQHKFVNLLKNWSEKCPINTYAFYVKLRPDADYPEAEKVIKDTDNLYEVKTSNVDLNIISLADSVTFNAKNEKYCDIEIKGKVNSESIKIEKGNNSIYSIDRYNISGNKIRLYISSTEKQKPEETDLLLNIDITKKSELDVLITKQVKVKCIYKRERTLKITIK